MGNIHSLKEIRGDFQISKAFGDNFKVKIDKRLV